MLKITNDVQGADTGGLPFSRRVNKGASNLELAPEHAVSFGLYSGVSSILGDWEL